MRHALIGLAAAIVVSAAGTQTGHAQFNNRYCSFGGGQGSSGEPDCSFSTMAQCRAAAAGLGRYCGPNPHYRGGRSSRRNRDY